MLLQPCRIKKPGAKPLSGLQRDRKPPVSSLMVQNLARGHLELGFGAASVWDGPGPN